MYYGIFINAFYVYIIIKMPVLLVLSVNNRYTELIRVNIRYNNNREGGGGNLTGCRFYAQVSFSYLAS